MTSGRLPPTCGLAELAEGWRVARGAGGEVLRVSVSVAELSRLDAASVQEVLAEGARVRLVVQMPPTGAGLGAALRAVLKRVAGLDGVELSGPDSLVDAEGVAAALEAASRAARSAGVPLLPVPGTFPTCLLLAALPDAPVPSRPTGPEEPDRYYGSCHVCAARPGCPGAPPDAWSHPGSSALDPPQVVLDPWQLREVGGDGPLQSVVEANLGDLSGTARALDESPAPTRWLLTRAWTPALAELSFTHLAVEFDAQHLPLDAVEALARLQRPFAAALVLPASAIDVQPIVGLLQRLGALSVALLGGEGWSVLDRARLGLPPAR